MNRTLASVVATLLLLVAAVFASPGVATAQGCADSVACEDGNTDGEVEVETPGGPGSEGGTTGDSNDDGVCQVWEPCYCVQNPDYGDCGGSNGPSSLPACVYEDGVATNEPCQAPAQPCVAFPDPDVADEPCGPDAIVPPDIPPPTAGEIGQQAVDNIVWPVVNPHPEGYAGQILAGGFEHSLVTWGYEDWVPLSADASITKTVVVSGVAFSETFTATLVATPVEVRWDTGPNNDHLSRHNPPTTVTCDGPGDSGFHQTDRPFQDWQTYSSYGGSECKFVWWGLTDDVGAPTTITAEISWDLVLTTNWDGAVTNIGEHLEQYASGGWTIDVPSAVNVNAGAWDSSTVELPFGWGDD